MKFVLSTLTNSFIFVKYSKPVLGSKGNYVKDPQPLRRILIAGGANRPNSRGTGEYTTDNNGIPMWTPNGIITPVDDLDIQWMMEDRGFKSFIDAGHIRVLNKDIGSDTSKIRKEVENGMVQRDAMSPLLPDDPRFKKSFKPSDPDAVADNAKPLTPEQLQSLLDA